MAASTLSERHASGGDRRRPRHRRPGGAAGRDLQLALACALLEKETAGGHNVFGHDRDRHGTLHLPGARRHRAGHRGALPPVQGKRKATGLPQGVGPCQLTFAPFQEQADALGGCWKPAANIRVGFKVLADNIRVSGQSAGVMLYNGSGPAARAYSQDVLAKARSWDAMLAGAPVPKVVAATGSCAAVTGVTAVERITGGWRSCTRGAPRRRVPRRRAQAVRRRAVAALKAFQRDNRLLVDGVFGDESARRLVRAVKAERARRKKGGGVVVKTASAAQAERARGAAAGAGQGRAAARSRDRRGVGGAGRVRAQAGAAAGAAAGRGRRRDEARAREAGRGRQGPGGDDRDPAADRGQSWSSSPSSRSARRPREAAAATASAAAAEGRRRRRDRHRGRHHGR